MYYEESAHVFFPGSSGSRRRNCFLQFLTLFSSCMDEKLIHSAFSWLLSQHLFRCFFSPSPRSTATNYFLLHAPSLPTQPSPRTTLANPHRQVMLRWWGPALQVRAASKISKTEEGVNERPTVTREVIFSIKEREDFMLYVPVIQRETDTMATSLSGSSRALL